MFSGITKLSELNKEYRRLSLIHHPDVGGSVEYMQEINRCYNLKFRKIKQGSGLKANYPDIKFNYPDVKFNYPDVKLNHPMNKSKRKNKDNNALYKPSVLVVIITALCFLYVGSKLNNLIEVDVGFQPLIPTILTICIFTILINEMIKCKKEYGHVDIVLILFFASMVIIGIWGWFSCY